MIMGLMYDTLFQTHCTLNEMNMKCSITFWSANIGIIKAQELDKIKTYTYTKLGLTEDGTGVLAYVNLFSEI